MKRNNLAIWTIAVLLLGIFVSSCEKRPEGVLSAKEMENLMVNLHVLEGTLQVNGVANSSISGSEAYYTALFEKYGITQQQFDSCLAWYTVHPKKFERIYLNVTKRIDDLSADVTARKYHPIDSTARDAEIELWTKPIKYTFTKDSARNQLDFEIENGSLLAEDMYVLSFLHRLAPSDSSVNPHAVMYVNYWNGEVDSIYTKTKNDSVLRRYMMQFKARKKLKVKSVSGRILGTDAARGKMNVTVDSISLLRKYQSFMQDSIRAEVERVDTTSTVRVKEPLLPVEKKELKPGMQDIKL